MQPQVGVTHDVVIYVNDSIMCGLIVKPYSYNVTHLPTFIPRMSIGDQTGVDTTRWRSFVQQSFYMGAGQYIWSSPNANAGYAESVLMDLGMPSSIAGVIVQDDPAWAFGSNLAPIGHATVAIVPSAMTATAGIAQLFSASYPVHVLEWSGNPHILHNVSLMTYTNNPEATWAASLQGSPTDALSGTWARVADANSFGTPIVSVVEFSTTLIAAVQGQEIVVFGPAHNTNFSRTYKPLYNTLTNRVTTFDNKLWRVYGAKAAYLQPANNTQNWSDFYNLGKVDRQVLNTCEYGGKLFFGKEDSLWVFDAGQTYLVQDYSQEISSDNFNMMVEHRGYMYYNINSSLYRYYSATGLIERIRTPYFDGPILSGVSCVDELLFVVRNGTETLRAPQTWIFDPETGGIRMWFEDVRDVNVDPVMAGEDSPSKIAALRGNVFITPMYMSGTAVANRADGAQIPVVTALRTALISGRVYEGAQLITSAFDFGLPSLEKMYNKVKIDVKMDTATYMDVYISTDPVQLTRMLDRPMTVHAIYNSTDYFSSAIISEVAGGFVAYPADFEYTSMELEGARSQGAVLFGIGPYAEFTRDGLWWPVPATAFVEAVDTSAAHDASLTLSSLPSWGKQLVSGAVAQAQYAVRVTQMPVVPTATTVVLNTANVDAHTCEYVVVDGSLVIDGGTLCL